MHGQGADYRRRRAEALADNLYCDYRPFAHCEPCRRTVPLDLPALVLEHGRDYPLARLRDRFRCRHCGGKLGITITSGQMA